MTAPPPGRPAPADADAVRLEALKSDPFLARHGELEAAGTFEECPLHWLMGYAGALAARLEDTESDVDWLSAHNDRLAARLADAEASEKGRGVVDAASDIPAWVLRAVAELLAEAKEGNKTRQRAYALTQIELKAKALLLSLERAGVPVSDVIGDAAGDDKRFERVKSEATWSKRVGVPLMLGSVDARFMVKYAQALRDRLRHLRGADEQLDILANFIMAEVPGEPSRSEGAGDCAIRIIRELRVRLAGAEAALGDLRAASNEAQAILIRLYTESAGSPIRMQRALMTADGILRRALAAREHGGGEGEGG